MKTSRRNFIKTSLSGIALAGAGAAIPFASCAGAAEKAKQDSKTVELKLSFQEWIAPGKTLAERLDFMEKLGVVGFEPGGSGLENRVQEIKDALQGRPIKVSAICAGFKGFLLSTDPAVRQECIDSMKTILAAAGELGSVGVILVPGFNGQKPAMPHTQETRNFLCEELSELGDYAAAHSTTLILEPLHREEAFFLRQVADAASICRDANSPGVRCMGDFWHMTNEETSDMGALISAGKYLQHVHIASRKRRSVPVEDGDADNYIDGFRALKMLEYDKYVSYECGCQGDPNTVLPESVKLLREQWEKA